jgi:hypothetical protein
MTNPKPGSTASWDWEPPRLTTTETQFDRVKGGLPVISGSQTSKDRPVSQRLEAHLS